MGTQPLADPRWTAADPICIACQYQLAGLASEGLCPECGTAYTARRLELQGIPSAISGGKWWRRLVWIGLIVVGGVLSQFWPFLLLLGGGFGAWAALFVFVLLVVGIIAMIATSKRERRGSERLIFTPAGIGQLPLKPAAEGVQVDSVFMPWGAANSVELKRVSAFWRTLRIGAVARPGAPMTPIFRAGVRCPDAAAEEVTRYLLAMIHKTPLPRPTDERRVIGLAPPTTPPSTLTGEAPPPAPPTAD